MRWWRHRPLFAGPLYLAATNARAIQITNPASAVNYLHLSGSATGVGPGIQAAGSDTNIPLYIASQGTGSLLFQTNSGTTQMTIDGTGKVGIGTSGPSNKLHAYQNTAANLFAEVQNANVIYNAGLELLSSEDWWVESLGSGSGTTGSFIIYDNTQSAFRLLIDSTGKVGLSTSSPKSVLDVNGNMAVGTYAGATAAPANSIIVSGTVAIGTTIETAGTALDLGTNTNSILLPVGTTGQRPTGVNGMLRYNSTVPQVEAYYSGGWNAMGGGAATTITLGTSAAATNPQRSGQVNTGIFSASSNVVSIAEAGTDIADFSSGGLSLAAGLSYKISGIGVLWQDTVSQNLAVGNTSFPTTFSQAGGGNNGTLNTAVGLMALGSNTTGQENTALGYYALTTNTTGTGNTAVGMQALTVSSTGVNNTALGMQSLYRNTTGSNNTALGQGALNSNTTGGYNVGVGVGSLKRIPLGNIILLSAMRWSLIPQGATIRPLGAMPRSPVTRQALITRLLGPMLSMETPLVPITRQSERQLSTAVQPAPTTPLSARMLSKRIARAHITRAWARRLSTPIQQAVITQRSDTTWAAQR